MNARSGRPMSEYLRSRFSYDPETGDLFWKSIFVRPGRERADNAWNSNFSGKRAGHLTENNYITVGLDGRRYYAHQIIWVLVTGEWPIGDIDHKDLDGANNRWRNLRGATRSQNRQNTGRERRNKSGFKGVSKHVDGKWQAAIKVDRKTIYLGLFGTPEEAHAAYVEAANLHFGEFARAA